MHIKFVLSLLNCFFEFQKWIHTFVSRSRENVEIQDNSQIRLSIMDSCNVLTRVVVLTFFIRYDSTPTSPPWTKVSSFTRFLDNTQRRIRVSRTLLGEWSARRRDLYLTTHDTHSRQTFAPPVVFFLITHLLVLKLSSTCYSMSDDVRIVWWCQRVFSPLLCKLCCVHRFGLSCSFRQKMWKT